MYYNVYMADEWYEVHQDYSGVYQLKMPENYKENITVQIWIETEMIGEFVID